MMSPPAREASTLIVDDRSPGRSLALSEIMAGDAVEQHFAFDAAAWAAFSAVANDRAPVHHDPGFAHSVGFSGPIIQGLCVSTRFSRLIGMYLPGERAVLEGIDLKFRKPTYRDQPLVFRAEVERVLPPMGVVRLLISVSGADGVQVSGRAQCLIR
jgi:3-hydroxybutyryl-CoA dehydratase